MLNDVWAGSVKTADLTVSDPVDLDPRGCPVPAMKLILDGWVRDRCPYIGDVAVTSATLMVAHADTTPTRNMILLFASLQDYGGFIRSTPCICAPELIDYPAYWVDTLYEYVLHTGDLNTARQVWPNLTRLLDRWYPSVLEHGLVANTFGSRADYAFIDRKGRYVGYYNAEYARSLLLGSKLAEWLGESARAAAWRGDSREMAKRIEAAFWDPGAGAFRDTTDGPLVHAQDTNAFAVLAGVGTLAQQRSALAYIGRVNWRSWGNSIADSDAWDGCRWGYEASQRVYPFIGYYELLARFAVGDDNGGVDLLRREWGYMLRNGPPGTGTMWETIGPAGGPPIDPHPSWAHGWSSGAAPALSEYVLGVRPTSPGYATYVVQPHTGDIQWAEGAVPTPRGLLHVSWKRGAGNALAVSSWFGDTPPAALAPVRRAKPSAKPKTKTTPKPKRTPKPKKRPAR